MATAVLPPPPPPISDQTAAGSFSPLTLFECTMTNAGMLVDSMSVRDLVSALRIIGTLHTHVVNVMDPGVAVACDLADKFGAHRATCPSAAAAAEGRSNGRSSDASPAAAAASASVDGLPRKRMKADDDSLMSAADNNSSSAMMMDAAVAFVKSESLVESDDDCCILDDSGAVGGSAFFASVRHMNPPPPIGASASTAAACAQDTSTMKQILRNTYKSMRGGGPHLYDFNRPWNDPANQMVTERIVSQIVTTTPDMSASPDEWRTQLADVLPELACKPKRDLVLKRLTNRKCGRLRSKLSRRQKAFEQVLPTLNPDDLDKYRVVLSRDFTSSDEETDDEASGETALRVRELGWESDEVRRVKQRLDQTFMNRFATQKQRATLQRCIRDPGCLSNRPAPHEAPLWALRPSPPGEA